MFTCWGQIKEKEQEDREMGCSIFTQLRLEVAYDFMI